MKCSKSAEDINCSTNLESKKQATNVQDARCSQVDTKEVSKSKSKKKRKEGVSVRRHDVNKQKTNRIKKASSKAGCKWQPIPQTLLNAVLSMLEESISSFTDSGNNASQRDVDKITVSVQQALKKLKVPKVTWTDSKSLKSSKRILLTEKKRLEDLECALSATLEEEIRQTKLLQSKGDRLKTISTTMDDQLNAILRGPQESS